MKENTTGDWKIETESEEFLSNVLKNAFKDCPEAETFALKMQTEIAVRMRDILDHFTFSDSSLAHELMHYGWLPDENDRIFRNGSGLFPDFVKTDGQPRVFFRVEFVQDFLNTVGKKVAILGQKGSQLRMAHVFSGSNIEFWVIERHGTLAYEPFEISPEIILKAEICQQDFRARRRQFDTVIEGLEYTEAMVDKVVNALGADWACDLFLRAEREYWMQRNRAGRIQKERQDTFGIGWANQDHHTFDSSRQHFFRTIRILEKLGFECRELFYAGADAGWGSQILEQPKLKSVIFADIDLAPEELDFDFAHDESIKPLFPLRRAGLWCAMHGESMLEAGLNHLECMYDSRRFNEIFDELGIEMMNPFSDFPHLYQALTVGEWWAVAPERIDALEKAGNLSREEADDFRRHGAIGSHFENLERNGGFKGFNQPGIDDVLRIIDPRKQILNAEM